ncbi:MAG: tol-pal system protein YbgF [Deltaproteobacteria bacterium]|nr:tol-pal system protein YbgF [Deltaproteobacteria bacterium]
MTCKYLAHLFLGGLLLAGLLTGCVSDQAYVELDNRVSNLQQQVAALEKKQAENFRRCSNDLQKLTADTNVKLDSLETELQVLSANIEETHAAPRELPAVENKDLQLMFDRLDARLQKLEAEMQQLQQSGAIKPGAAAAAASTTSPAKTAKKTKTGAPAAAGLQKPGAREKAVYDDAYAAFKRGDYQTARKKFKKFIAAFPRSTYKVNALFWLAECSYKQKKYEEAIIKYDEIITKYPHHPKAPSALLKQGFSFLMLGDQTDGKIILEKVVSEYPDSDQAKIARRKLELMAK